MQPGPPNRRPVVLEITKPSVRVARMPERLPSLFGDVAEATRETKCNEPQTQTIPRNEKKRTWVPKTAKPNETNASTVEPRNETKRLSSALARVSRWCASERLTYGSQHSESGFVFVSEPVIVTLTSQVAVLGEPTKNPGGEYGKPSQYFSPEASGPRLPPLATEQE